MAHLCFGIEDQFTVQGRGHLFHELLPNPVLQKLLGVHLRVRVRGGNTAIIVINIIVYPITDYKIN